MQILLAIIQLIGVFISAWMIPWMIPAIYINYKHKSYIPVINYIWLSIGVCMIFSRIIFN